MGPTLKSMEEGVNFSIPVPWGKIEAKAWGKPDKLPVLGIHGWMDNAATFDRLLPQIRKDSMYFVAIDLPGHGLSSQIPPGLSYNHGEYLAVMRRATNFLKWSRFSMIGHSMGGALAASFAAMFPKIVDKVVVIDMIKPLGFEEGMTPESMANAIDEGIKIADKQEKGTQPSYSYQETMQRWIKGTFNALTEESAKCLMTRGAYKVGEDDKWAFRRDLRLTAPIFNRFDHPQSISVLKGLECPLLLVRAKGSPIFGMSEEVVNQALDMYKEKCRPFKYVEVEGNHFVHLNEPEKIAELINQFFSENESNANK